MNFSIMDFFSKCDQIRRKLWIWPHLLKKFLMENLTFCAVKGSVNQFLKLFKILATVPYNVFHNTYQVSWK